eukprot:3834333-Amphidinium_carterae.1
MMQREDFDSVLLMFEDPREEKSAYQYRSGHNEIVVNFVSLAEILHTWLCTTLVYPGFKLPGLGNEN